MTLTNLRRGAPGEIGYLAQMQKFETHFPIRWAAFLGPDTLATAYQIQGCIHLAAGQGAQMKMIVVRT